jgi:hypothetical protein
MERNQRGQIVFRPPFLYGICYVGRVEQIARFPAYLFHIKFDIAIVQSASSSRVGSIAVRFVENMERPNHV